ncbi:phospholipase D-like domain-containing protein [Thermocoleostomius sinensis]|uniref:phospholipase D n=1 Tax=Thermocoleostomius sinensis A174 TaxID=2016057 RepID=A0A9E9C8U1_9CYAN|nr:phospholipase D-like domain-containing protein [Thermocoleostomius sinensis]WAL61774.1 phospholipase D-like domain-containing protein [Thermocoleostomius sinensis A174]
MRLRSSTWFCLAALFLLGVLLFLGLTFLHKAPAIHSSLPRLPQDPLIEAYFNQAQTATYIDPYRRRQRSGDNLEQLIIEAINSAQASIDVAAHELNVPGIAHALKTKHQAGVRVRVIIENTYSRPLSKFSVADVNQLDERARKKYNEFVQLVDRDGNGQLSAREIAENDTLVVLQSAGVPLIDDTADGSKGSDLMHHKFVVIDNTVVIVGSANFTLSDIHGDFAAIDSRGNANHLLKITSPDLASIFTEEFNEMWGDGVGGRTDSKFGLQKSYRSPQTITLSPNSTITIQFSPTSMRQPWQQSVNGLIAKTLARADRTIDLMLFVFSEQQLSDVLQTNHQRGVRIRALVDRGFAFRDYSELLDLTGIALMNNRCRYEENNRPWNRPIATVGTPNLPDGDLLHHKVGIVDGKTVITGSQNWSDAANRGNDENLLVIENKTVAAHFEREFDRLYQNASLGVPSSVQAKIRQQQSRC